MYMYTCFNVNITRMPLVIARPKQESNRFDRTIFPVNAFDKIFFHVFLWNSLITAQNIYDIYVSALSEIFHGFWVPEVRFHNQRTRWINARHQRPKYIDTHLIYQTSLDQIKKSCLRFEILVFTGFFLIRLVYTTFHCYAWNNIVTKITEINFTACYTS